MTGLRMGFGTNGRDGTGQRVEGLFRETFPIPPPTRSYLKIHLSPVFPGKKNPRLERTAKVRQPGISML
jgi:hypothetical protein